MFRPGRRENFSTGGVVSAVDDGAFIPPLKTAGPLHVCQTADDSVIGNLDLASAQSTDGERGILLLVRAMQRDLACAVGCGNEGERRSAFGRPGPYYFFGSR